MFPQGNPMESLLNRVLLLVFWPFTNNGHVNPMESLHNHVLLLVTNNTTGKANDFNDYPCATRARARLSPPKGGKRETPNPRPVPFAGGYGAGRYRR